MNSATAQLNNYRQSPRKVRLVADAIKGKSVMDAKSTLTFLTKRASSPLHKLLNSAISNAKNVGLKEDTLKVQSIAVNGGQIMYRRRPVAHGAAHPIRKRTSHIKIVLISKEDKKIVNKKSKK